MFKVLKCNKRNYLTVLITSILLMIVFVLSLNWGEGTKITRKILSVGVIVFCVIVIPMLAVVLKPFNNGINKFFQWLGRIKEYSRINSKCVVIRTIVFILIFPIGLLGGKVVSPNPYVGYTICTILLILYSIYLYKRISGDRPEGSFACVAIILGVFMITVTPATPGIMLDDESHYMRVIRFSNEFDGSYYKAEEAVLSGFTDVIFNKKTYDKESRENYYASLNDLYETKEQVGAGVPTTIGIYSIAYIPSAIGIIIAKGLHLSFIHTFMAGKLFNLLFYVLLMYFAIKKLKYGKILFATLGLIPSNIFMASCYAYDSWVFGFVALAFAYFISMLQSDEIIATKDIILMNVFFFLAFMPKAVYVVMMFPLLFMPKRKFKDKRQRALYYLAAVITVLLLLASFVLPFLTAGTGEDLRGGTDVSAFGQLSFVFSNMGYFLKVLFGFLKSFVSFANSQKVFQLYAYLGDGKFYILTLVTLFVVAFLDRKPTKHHNTAVRIGGIIGAALGIIIVAFTFYLAFTPVGANTINGCQPRYILPVLIPFMYFIVPDGIVTLNKKTVLVNTAVLIMSMTFIYNIYNLSVKLYM